ncbi:DUF5641 domain-containing protein [Nephila pilipes]|uniref:DUF5641 domain-containing protein n=1 Tax=Nephila pilipes TaxID=299642 RepID=A0A8X6PN96_NEPPI|nr:DUF5641 domain-containing protein [Nephila pilipes]
MIRHQRVVVPGLDVADHNSLNKRIKYRQAIQRDLRDRFRSEYLGQLVQKRSFKTSKSISAGDIVLVGSDNLKKIYGPLGKIIELLQSKDKGIRLVRVKTTNSMLLRPIQ